MPIIFGDFGRDTLTGTFGDDDIFGLDGNDELTGGSRPEVLDVLDGGNGDDIIHLGNGNAAYGGLGTDRAVIDRDLSQIAFVVDFTAGGNGKNIDDGSAIAGFENLFFTGGLSNDKVTGGSSFDVIDGGDGNDVIAGGSGENYLYGGNGDDTIAGGGGMDFVYDGAGADTVNGGSGDDRIYSEETFLPNAGDKFSGGSGNDWLVLVLKYASENITIDLTLGGGRKDIGNGTTIAQIEGIDFTGGAGDGTVTGGALGNVFRGGLSKDVFNGASGSDQIYLSQVDGLADKIDGGSGAAIDFLFLDLGMSFFRPTSISVSAAAARISATAPRLPV
jgi:hypothetical protein